MLLFFFAIIEIIKNFYIDNFDYNPLYESYNFKDFVLNFFFLNGFELSPHTFNQPSWTVSLLIWTVIFYSIINLWNKKISIYFSILFSTILTFIIITNYSYEFMYKYRNLLLLLSFSLTQVFCYYLLNTNILKKWTIIIYTFSLTLSFYLFYFYKDLSTIFFYFILIFLIFKKNKKIKLTKFKKICIYLGNISFIWFMSHYLITFLMRQILKIIFEFKINLNDNTIIFGYGSNLIVLLVIISSLFFSIALYEINKKIVKN